MRTQISNWLVDYGQGPQPVSIPHGWGTEISVRAEGPFSYTCSLASTKSGDSLFFHGVSYQARVFQDDELISEHQGIWDAFIAPLRAAESSTIRVEVIKNGGATFPVRNVLSGFYPYVFNTFGGIFRPVELISGETVSLDFGIQPSEFEVRGSKIFWRGKPFYMRGILNWGWYPHRPHCDIEASEIRDELQKIVSLGFNCVKFCLYMPTHEYLEIMAELNLAAWIELPLWDPIDDPIVRQNFATEIDRIVRQYRHHPNIACWTIGCELSKSVPSEWRRDMVAHVKELTGSPLVKDNSGGSEMYGGSAQAFGDFDDFHPYCDMHYFRPVVESLCHGPRPVKPILLGETNDYDTLRLPREVQNEYWASTDPDLNDQGVRWQYDLPRIQQRESVVTEINRPISIKRKHDITKYVCEVFSSIPDISGFVLTGLRDTPISTSGILDDRGDLKMSMSWNAEDHYYLLPRRRPPWINGGNRPGWQDPYCHFEGEVSLLVGLRTTSGDAREIEWELADEIHVVASGKREHPKMEPLSSQVVLELNFSLLQAGSYCLTCSDGQFENEWRLWVFCRWEFEAFEKPCRALAFDLENGWAIAETEPNENAILFRKTGDPDVVNLPFFRECVLDIDKDMPVNLQSMPLQMGGVTDCFFEGQFGRIDTRNHSLHCTTKFRNRNIIETTLNPWGGVGDRPYGLENNPVGAELLWQLMQCVEAMAKNSPAY